MTAIHIIREQHDNSYWTGNRWTPASDEAKQFDTHDEARAEGEEKCEARSWVVVEVAEEEDGEADEAGLVCGNKVQVDLSGVGHCWRDALDITGDIRLELEGAMIDGGMDSCDDYVAGNGLHYRW